MNSISRDLAEFDEFFGYTTRDGISCGWILEPTETISPEDVKSKYFVFYLPSRHFMRDSHKYLVILKSAVVEGKVLTIKLSNSWRGKVIGSGGSNIKEIAKQLNLPYVRVEPIEEN